ncbi:MAG: hypothetical protein AABZ69_07670, partial [Candidatus Binatota bacterium]
KAISTQPSAVGLGKRVFGCGPSKEGSEGGDSSERSRWATALTEPSRSYVCALQPPPPRSR